MSLNKFYSDIRVNVKRDLLNPNCKIDYQFYTTHVPNNKLIVECVDFMDLKVLLFRVQFKDLQCLWKLLLFNCLILREPQYQINFKGFYSTNDCINAHF